MGIFSSGSSKRAAQVQAEKLAQANTLLGEAGDKYGAYYDPYRQAGEAATGNLQQTLGGVQDRINALDPKIAGLYGEREALQPQVSEMYTLSQQQDPVVQEILGGGQGFQTSPGYQFALEEGQRALERSRAASGTLNSGATGRELTRYSQGMANQEYNNYLNQLQGKLGAVNTQLGGRATALDAGQNQINQGINLLGQDFNQINQQQNLAQQYQQLVNSGMSAADAAAKLGMNVAQLQAGNTAAQGDAYASGMVSKSNQLLGMGQGIAKAAGAVGGFMLGGPAGAAMGAQLGGSLAGSPSAMPTTTANYGSSMPSGAIDLGSQMPWLNSSPTQAQKSLSQSSYAQPRYYA